MAAAGLLTGAALGLASAELTRRIGGRTAVVGASLGLVGAAVIYPPLVARSAAVGSA